MYICISMAQDLRDLFNMPSPTAPPPAEPVPANTPANPQVAQGGSNKTRRARKPRSNHSVSSNDSGRSHTVDIEPQPYDPSLGKEYTTLEAMSRQGRHRRRRTERDTDSEVSSLPGSRAQEEEWLEADEDELLEDREDEDAGEGAEEEVDDDGGIDEDYLASEAPAEEACEIARPTRLKTTRVMLQEMHKANSRKKAPMVSLQLETY